jgi:hypothetical protein
VLKARVNHCGKMTLGDSPFVTVGYTNRETKVGGVSSEHFGPCRPKAFSPGSKVEPGLKARTKASVSTSGFVRQLTLNSDFEFESSKNVLVL